MKALKILVFIFGLSLCQVNAGIISNVFNAATGVIKGVAKDAENLLPTPTELFDMSKQSLAGYPFEYVASAVNRVCSSALSSQTIVPKETPNIREMKFQLRTACDRYSFPLLKAEEMWHSPAFEPTKKVVILTTGWTTTINDTIIYDTIDDFSKAYNCRGDYNFVAVDVAAYVRTLYTWSALNTEAIGEALGQGIVQLSKVVPIENIHLIGHSLGAHIVGYAGRKFNYLTGKTLPRITGLDPAKPCFNEGESLGGIQRGDAEFIDIIHSNSGVLGKNEPLGDVDFYPHGVNPLPPGCVTVVCAHMRATEYYAETVYPGNERNFMGTRCNSLSKLLEGKCAGKLVPMGINAPSNIKGNYFLEVNGKRPFGKVGNTAWEISNKNCGLCNKQVK